jgi:hypothetical protein
MADVRHTFVSPVADDGDPNEVGPNEWNAAHTVTGDIIGPPGLPGEDGEEGPVGPPGPAGPAGAAGAPGSTGAQGNQGPPGAEIEPDEPFIIPGPQGPTGATGNTGNTGPTGPQGNQGPPGYDTEPDYEPWLVQGPQGATGSTGTQGIQGVAGTPGPPLYETPDLDEPWMIQGPAGAIGPQGPPGASSSGGSATVPSEPFELDWEPLVPVAPASILQTPIYVQDNTLFRIPDSGLMFQVARLGLSVRGDLRGTARLQIGDSDDASVLKFRSPGSFTVSSDEYVPAWDRIQMLGNARATMRGTARIQNEDWREAPGRLVLSGRGGGS